MKRVLAIHTRDIRLFDNALYAGDDIVVSPLFIFTDAQVENNDYFGAKAFTFLIESLVELDASIRDKGGCGLAIVRGVFEDELRRVLVTNDIDEVRIARDYTPFARERERIVTDVCDAAGVASVCVDNHLLVYPGEVCTEDGGTYAVFTPFYKKAVATVAIPKVEYPKVVPVAESLLEGTDVLTTVIDTYRKMCVDPETLATQPGRKAALAILNDLPKRYSDRRDMLDDDDGTTRLSAHHKFGTISLRESYWAMKRVVGNEAMVRQLYWHDFFVHIANNRPDVLGHAFNEKYDTLAWKNPPTYVAAWKEGCTGVPVVDAGIRQLTTTGYMHNRARMIVGSFLVKDLLCDWQIGEQFFAQHLIDYDPAVNNGSWQWVAGTGADAAPYFRIFNPWLQSKKFDPDATYIKTYLPELRDVPAGALHDWEKKHAEYDVAYPAPIVVHKEQRDKILALFGQ